VEAPVSAAARDRALDGAASRRLAEFALGESRLLVPALRVPDR
jgi:hypothetical protein